jgi:hypothetical protein
MPSTCAFTESFQLRDSTNSGHARLPPTDGIERLFVDVNPNETSQ